MNASWNARPVVMAMFLAVLACLSIPPNTWAQEKRISGVDAEVVIYGEENAIVDAMTKKSHAQDNRKYPNELDHVFSVLLSRAHPKPEANNLARHTIDALCKEVEAIVRIKIVDSQRGAWMANRRATVIGQRTAGVLGGHDGEKLGDGRLIVFRSEPTVLSPTGSDYSETGLPPDILVDESKGSGEDKILGRAIQLLQTRPQKDTLQKPVP